MHILLTDILTCPRCGPAFGLILLADRIQGRRVVDGVLGCANCREKYPVRNGRIDFTGSAADAPPTDAQPEDPDEAMRLAALLGVTEGPANVLLVGPPARHARAIADLVEGVEVTAAAHRGEPGVAIDTVPGVSPVAIAGALPFATARLAGVVLGGESADALLEEGARATAPLGRLVLEPAPEDAEKRLSALGLRVLLRQDRTMVAARH
jgi:uncharacterized protein YbaR (Trm112 family)